LKIDRFKGVQDYQACNDLSLVCKILASWKTSGSIFFQGVTLSNNNKNNQSLFVLLHVDLPTAV